MELAVAGVVSDRSRRAMAVSSAPGSVRVPDPACTRNQTNRIPSRQRSPIKNFRMRDISPHRAMYRVEACASTRTSGHRTLSVLGSESELANQNLGGRWRAADEDGTGQPHGAIQHS